MRSKNTLIFESAGVAEYGVGLGTQRHSKT